MSESDGGLTVIEHLEELRDRLIRALIALVVCTLFSLIFTGQFLKVLTAPMGVEKPIFIRPTEMFFTYMQVALIGGLALAMPVIAYEFVKFVLPALFAHERRYLYIIIPAASFSFLAGLAFAYFLMLPAAIEVLLRFGADIASPQWRIGEYFSFVSALLIGMGFVFELPLVIFFLAKAGIVTSKMLSSYRKLAILLNFILAAIITPTGDPVNMSLVVLPLLVLYEIGVLLAKLA